MAHRKLSRPSDQRQAMLRNQVTSLIWHGRIETTLQRAKEVSSIAERLITLAVRECDNSYEITKSVTNDKKQIVELKIQNDKPSKLAARRKMLSYLYFVPMAREEKETKKEYHQRTRVVNDPVIEKLKRALAGVIPVSSRSAPAVATPPRWSYSSWSEFDMKRNAACAAFRFCLR